MSLLKTGTESEYRLHPYDTLALAQFGGADPDSSDDARPPGWFKELHNMRFETPGSPVTRSGIKQFVLPPTTPGTTKWIPLAKCEYVVWSVPTGGSKQVEYRCDVTLLFESGPNTLSLYLLDKRRRDGSHVSIPIPVTDPIPPYDPVLGGPSGCLMQFGNYIIVSLFDHQSYIAWPVGTPEINGAPAISAFPVDQTIPTAWTVEVLGKDVCPTPTKYDFPQTLTGDLLVFSANLDGATNAYDTGGFFEGSVFEGPQGTRYTLVYDYASPTDTTRQILRLPLGADYHRSGWLRPADADSTLDPISGQIVDAIVVSRWKAAAKDAALLPGEAGLPSSRLHLQHRGYFYRFVRVETIYDSEGSPIKRRSNASVDLFVPAVNYSPFFWVQNTPGQARSFPSYVASNGSSSHWSSTIHPNFGVPNDQTTNVPGPALDAMAALQKKYIDYFNPGGGTSNGTAGTGGVFQWVAGWLGWSVLNGIVDYHRQAPYQVDVSAEELTSSPQTIFQWADFPGLNATDVIEVYRTAYEDVDPEKRPVSTPLFEPHVYGLVGTIEDGGTFTDTTKIPDFGADPSQYDGYLRGQFSGDVIRDYGQSPALVLGNVRTNYEIQPPSPLIQAFFVRDALLGVIDISELIGDAGDGLPKRTYYIAYIDRSGYRSAPVRVNIEIPTPHPDTGVGAIFFTLPYGYDPNIANIVVYEGYRNDAAIPPVNPRVYSEVKTDDSTQSNPVKPEPGIYIYDGFNSATATATLPSGDTPKFYEPGAIIYSNPNAPWDWPQSQIEKHHASAPVRCLEVLMGELAVVTDESYTLTLLRKQVPRSEEDTRWLGCISKHAHAKIDDACVILSQHGLYFLVPSRPEGLNSNLDIEILPRLLEQVPQYLALAGLRGASMGYLARRKELWFHVPSSSNLWEPTKSDPTAYPNVNALSHKTFMFNFLGGLRKMENYTFDISPDFEITNIPVDAEHPLQAPKVDRTTYNPAKVIFSPGSDGTLYCGYAAPDGSLITIDCDDPDSDYQGTAYGTIALGLQNPSGQKQIVKTELLLTARGRVQIITGMPKKSSGDGMPPWDAVRGGISDRAQVYTFRTIYTDTPRVYKHQGVDRAVETKSSSVLLRIRTQPDASQRHRVELRGMTVYYDSKHQHS